MSMNLATYGLISALVVGGAGAVVQHQYSKPAGPNPPAESTDAVQPTSDNSRAAEVNASGTVDCNTLMSHHQQMMTDISRMDEQLVTQLTQMKEAVSDSAKLAAVMTVVDLLATQRKDMRDRLMAMEHETLQFMMANKGTDAMSGCPQLTEWLRQGAMLEEERGGPDDMEYQPPASPEQPPPQQR